LKVYIVFDCIKFAQLKFKINKMKKLMLFGLGALASISVLTSCKKDEVIPEGPKVTFVNGATYEAKAEDASYTFIASIEAAGELKEIKLFDVSNANNETQMGTTITKFDSDTKHTLNQKVDLTGKTGEIKIKVTVTDKKDQTNSSTFTIKTYKVPAGAINTYSAKIMGAQYNNGTGSFLSTSTGTIYSKTEAKTNASLVDFVYSYRGANMLAFIAAPSDALLDATLNIKVENWTKLNSTKFKLSTLTIADFDAIEDDSKFSSVDLTATNVLDLKEGNVVYFKTEAGKLGVFKVKSINKGLTGPTDFDKYQSGSIEIDVKVQQ